MSFLDKTRLSLPRKRWFLYYLSHRKQYGNSLYLRAGLSKFVERLYRSSTEKMWFLLALTVPATAAKSFQSCPTLCDPIDGSLPGSHVPGILQPRTLEWVAISFSNEGKWKVKVKSLSRVRLLATPWTTAYQDPPSMGFSRQEYGVGCHYLSPEITAIHRQPVHLPSLFSLPIIHFVKNKIGIIFY